MSRREIKLFVHDGSVYLQPSYLWMKELSAYMLELEAMAKAKLEETGADHVVYAVKSYDENGELCRLDAYMEPMDDATFHQRTDDEAKKNPGCGIYALHRLKG